jgi:hypothetical protein
MRLGAFVHRLTAAVLGLWFGIMTAEPARLHACPMHDLAMANVGTHQMAHHHGASHDQNSEKHSCTCVGTCAATAAPSAPVSPAVPVSIVAVSDEGIAALARAVVAPAFAIPFANGPPTA